MQQLFHLFRFGLLMKFLLTPGSKLLETLSFFLELSLELQCYPWVRYWVTQFMSRLPILISLLPFLCPKLLNGSPILYLYSALFHRPLATQARSVCESQLAVMVKLVAPGPPKFLAQNTESQFTCGFVRPCRP